MPIELGAVITKQQFHHDEHKQTSKDRAGCSRSRTPAFVLFAGCCTDFDITQSSYTWCDLDASELAGA